MTVSDFSPVADALREAVLDWYGSRGEQLEGDAGRVTLETNSGYVERRGRPLLEMLRRHAGIDGLDGLELVDLGAGFSALSAFFAAQGAAVTAVDTNRDRFEVGRSVAERFDLP